MNGSERVSAECQVLIPRHVCAHRCGRHVRCSGTRDVGPLPRVVVCARVLLELAQIPLLIVVVDVEVEPQHMAPLRVAQQRQAQKYVAVLEVHIVDAGRVVLGQRRSAHGCV